MPTLSVPGFNCSSEYFMMLLPSVIICSGCEQESSAARANEAKVHLENTTRFTQLTVVLFK